MKNVAKSVFLTVSVLASMALSSVSMAQPPAPAAPAAAPVAGDHFQNAQSLGFDYSWTLDAYNNVSGIVVTTPYYRNLSAYTNWCPLGLEPGDKVLFINNVRLINEFEIANAINSSQMYGSSSVAFVNIRTGVYETRNCQQALRPY